LFVNVEEAVGKVTTTPFSMSLPSFSKTTTQVVLEEILKAGKPTSVIVPLTQLTDDPKKLNPYREKIAVIVSRDANLPAGCVSLM
jgi:hypothetical protein